MNSSIERKKESFEQLHEKALQFFDPSSLKMRLLELHTNVNNSDILLRDGVFDLDAIEIGVALRNGANPNLYLLFNRNAGEKVIPLHISCYIVDRVRQMQESDDFSRILLSLLMKSGSNFKLPVTDEYGGKYATDPNNNYSIYDWMKDNNFNLSKLDLESPIVLSLLNFDFEKIDSYDCVKFHCGIKYAPKGMKLNVSYNLLHPEVYSAILLSSTYPNYEFPNYYFVFEKCRQISIIEKDVEQLIEEFILIDALHGAVPDFYQRSLLSNSVVQKLKTSIVSETKRGLWWLLKNSGNILTSYILTLAKTLNIIDASQVGRYSRGGIKISKLTPSKIFEKLEELASTDPMIVKQNYREYLKEKLILKFESGKSAVGKSVQFINQDTLSFDAFFYAEVDCVYYMSRDGYWCIPGDQFLRTLRTSRNPYNNELLTDDILDEIRDKQTVISQIPCEIYSFSKAIDDLRSTEIFDQIDRHSKNVISWFRRSNPNIKDLAAFNRIEISHWSEEQLRSIVSHIETEKITKKIWNTILI